MKMILFSIVVLILFSFSSTAYSADKMRIAVMDIVAKGVSQKVAVAVSDIIRAEIIAFGRYIVVERKQMDTILKEMEFQQAGCTDSECAVKIGRMLSVQKMLIGEINRVGKSMVITIRLVDIEKAVSEFSATKKAVSDDVIDSSAKAIASDIIDRIEESTSIKYMGYYLRGIAPGWGQMYAGNKIRGYGFIGAFALAASFTGYAYYNYTQKKGDYDDLKRGTATRDDFDKKYDEYDKAGKMYDYFLVFLGLVYAANWVDIVFFSRSDYTRMMEAKPVTTASVNGNVDFYTYYDSKRNENVVGLQYVRRF